MGDPSCTYEIGTYFAGEASLAWLPYLWTANGTVVGGIYCHSHGGDAPQPVHDAPAPAGHPHPLHAASGKYAGVPYLGYYGDSDTIVIPSTVTTLVSNIGATASAVSLSGGHAESTLAAVPPADVAAFVVAHV